MGTAELLSRQQLRYCFMTTNIEEEYQGFDCQCLNCDALWYQQVSISLINMLIAEQSQSLIDRFMIDNFPCPECSSFVSVVVPNDLTIGKS